jgi:hypothetical protein
MSKNTGKTHLPFQPDYWKKAVRKAKSREVRQMLEKYLALKAVRS